MKNNVYGLVFALIFLLNFLIICCTVNIINLVEIYIIIVFAMTLLTISIIVLWRCKVSSMKITLFVLMFALSLIPILIHKSGMEYYLNIIIFIMCSLLLINFNFYDNKILNIMLFFLIVLVIFSSTYSVKGDPSLDMALMDSIINPNTLSFMMYILSYIFLVLYRKKNKYIFLGVSLLIFCFEFTYLSRMAIFLNIFVYIVFLFQLDQIPLTKNIMFLVLIVVLPLQILYTYFYSTTLFDIVGKGNLLIFGKDIFTGRQVIWNDFFHQIRNGVIFGLGNTFKSSWLLRPTDTTTNLHNGSLGIISVFGILFYFIFFSFIVYIFIRKDKRYTYILFLLICINSFSDTIFFSSINIYFVILSLFITNLLDNYDGKHRKKYIF